MKKKNEITAWVGRDQAGDFSSGKRRDHAERFSNNPFSATIGAEGWTMICQRYGLALGLHRIVKKGEVARVTFTAKAGK